MSIATNIISKTVNTAKIMRVVVIDLACRFLHMTKQFVTMSSSTKAMLWISVVPTVALSEQKQQTTRSDMMGSNSRRHERVVVERRRTAGTNEP